MSHEASQEAGLRVRTTRARTVRLDQSTRLLAAVLAARDDWRARREPLAAAVLVLVVAWALLALRRVRRASLRKPGPELQPAPTVLAVARLLAPYPARSRRSGVRRCWDGSGMGRGRARCSDIAALDLPGGPDYCPQTSLMVWQPRSDRGIHVDTFECNVGARLPCPCRPAPRECFWRLPGRHLLPRHCWNAPSRLHHSV